MTEKEVETREKGGGAELDASKDVWNSGIETHCK
jgi:hypothetical protein